MRGLPRLLATAAPLALGFALGTVEHRATPELSAEARVLGSTVADPMKIDVRLANQIFSVDDVPGRLGDSVTVHFRVGRLTNRVYVQRVEAETFRDVLDGARETLEKYR